MIENIELSPKKPSIFSNLTERGRQHIQEYNDTLAYRGAVAELNKALEPFAESIKRLTSGDPPLVLTDVSEDKPLQSMTGSWRRHTLVTAKRDGLGIVTLSGDVKYDDKLGYESTSHYQGRHVDWYTKITHQTVLIQILKDGTLANVWSDKVEDVKTDYKTIIWRDDTYPTDPKFIDNRGEQAEAIESIAHLLELTLKNG